MQWLRSNKYLHGHEIGPRMAQTIESNIFITEFFGNLTPGEFALPMHDAIICKAQDTKAMKARLVKIMQVEYPELDTKAIENSFKISY